MVRSNISEGLNYKDLEGIMKPTIHVDEFAAKMGEDDEIVVISFFVRDSQASKDLVNWFEKGYDFVIDADRSPGEIKSNRYLIYVEMKRRSSVADNIQTLIDDLSTLTEFTPDDWIIHYEGETYPFSADIFRNVVPSSPKEYREKKEIDLNEMRLVAGLDHKPVYEKDKIMRELQTAAGL